MLLYIEVRRGGTVDGWLESYSWLALPDFHYYLPAKGIPGVFSSSVILITWNTFISQDIDFFRFFRFISHVRIYTGKFYNTNVIKTIDYNFQPRVGFRFLESFVLFFNPRKVMLPSTGLARDNIFHRFNGALINKFLMQNI